jgi:hypothetical protein
MAYDYIEKKFKQKKEVSQKSKVKEGSSKKKKVIVLKPGFVKKKP